MDSHVEILENAPVAQNYYKLTLRMAPSPIPRPGQFYQIRCSASTDPLFRRPFSVHRYSQALSGATPWQTEPRNGTAIINSLSVEILYRVAGRGTEWLSQRGQGEILDVLGPFGNGFLIDDSPDPIVLIARGAGIASVYAVGEEVRRKDKERKIFILMGARIGERLFYDGECAQLGEVFTYTDDGSRGFRGNAPALLAHLVKEKTIPGRFYVYACGPAEMLKDLAVLSLELQFNGQAALEERMGCGFGACLVCACPLKPDSIVRNRQWEKPALHWSEDGTQVYSLICKDGPVYDLKEVDWDEWTA